MSAETFYYVSFGGTRILPPFRLTEEQIDSIPRQGQADSFVSDLADVIVDPFDTPELQQDLKDELKEYGAWNDEELSDHAENLKRALWLACLDAQEGNGNVYNMDGSELAENHPYASR